MFNYYSPWITIHLLASLAMSVSSTNQAFAQVIPTLNDSSFNTSLTISRSDYPSNPPTDGRRVPGGSLTGNVGCRAVDLPLTAIAPEAVQGYTTRAHPTLTFYLPYTSEDGYTVEFSMLNDTQEERIYRTTVPMPEQSGIVQVNLPESSDTALEEDRWYVWYLEVSCDAETTLYVNGSIFRTNNPDATDLGFSYDATAELAWDLIANPDNQPTQEAWTELMINLRLETLLDGE
jgi:hypothetical protein